MSIISTEMLNALDAISITMQLAEMRAEDSVRWANVRTIWREVTGRDDVPSDLIFVGSWFADDFEIAERAGLDITNVKGQIARVLRPFVAESMHRQGLPVDRETATIVAGEQYYYCDPPFIPPEMQDLFEAAYRSRRGWKRFRDVALVSLFERKGSCRNDPIL